MKLSVFYDHIVQAARQQGITISDALIRVRNMGYSMVEMDLDALNEEVIARLKAVGLGISSVYCFFRFDSEPQTDRIRVLIDAALRCGAKRIMPIPGLFHGETGEERDKELERMLDGMSKLTRLAVQAGLTVTIEDFGDANSPIRDSRGMNYFLDRLSALYATFDTGNFRLAGEEELSAFHALKDRIAHVHLKDRSLTTEYGASPLSAADGTMMYPCAVGAGFIPMKEIFGRLADIGYGGVLSVEHFGADDQLLCMQKSADFVRTLVDID